MEIQTHDKIVFRNDWLRFFLAIGRCYRAETIFWTKNKNVGKTRTGLHFHETEIQLSIHLYWQWISNVTDPTWLKTMWKWRWKGNRMVIARTKDVSRRNCRSLKVWKKKCSHDLYNDTMKLLDEKAKSSVKLKLLKSVIVRQKLRIQLLDYIWLWAALE